MPEISSMPGESVINTGFRRGTREARTERFNRGIENARMEHEKQRIQLQREAEQRQKESQQWEQGFRNKEFDAQWGQNSGYNWQNLEIQKAESKARQNERTYNMLVNAGSDPEDAFTQAYGLSANAFQVNSQPGNKFLPAIIKDPVEDRYLNLPRVNKNAPFKLEDIQLAPSYYDKNTANKPLAKTVTQSQIRNNIPNNVQQESNEIPQEHFVYNASKSKGWNDRELARVNKRNAAISEYEDTLRQTSRLEKDRKLREEIRIKLEPRFKDFMQKMSNTSLEWTEWGDLIANNLPFMVGGKNNTRYAEQNAIYNNFKNYLMRDEGYTEEQAERMMRKALLKNIGPETYYGNQNAVIDYEIPENRKMSDNANTPLRMRDLSKEGI